MDHKYYDCRDSDMDTNLKFPTKTRLVKKERVFKIGDKVRFRSFSSLAELKEESKLFYDDSIQMNSVQIHLLTFNTSQKQKVYTILSENIDAENSWELSDLTGCYRDSWLVPAYQYDIKPGTRVRIRNFSSWEKVIQAEERVRQGGPLDKQKITVTEGHAQYLLLPRNKREFFTAYPAYSHDQTYYLEGIDKQLLWRSTWLSPLADVKITTPGTYQVIDYQGVNEQSTPGRALNKVLATLRNNKEEKEMNTPLKWEHYLKNMMNLSEISAKRAGSAALADKIVSLIHSRVNLPLPAHLRLLKWFPDVEAVVLLSALYLGIRLSGQTGEIFKQAEKVCWYALEGKTYDVAKRLIDQFGPLVVDIVRIGKDALKNELAPSE